MTKVAAHSTRFTFSMMVMLAVSAPFFAPAFSETSELIVIDSSVAYEITE